MNRKRKPGFIPSNAKHYNFLILLIFIAFTTFIFQTASAQISKDTIIQKTVHFIPTIQNKTVQDIVDLYLPDLVTDSIGLIRFLAKIDSFNQKAQFPVIFDSIIEDTSTIHLYLFQSKNIQFHLKFENTLLDQCCEKKIQKIDTSKVIQSYEIEEFRNKTISSMTHCGYPFASIKLQYILTSDTVGKIHCKFFEGDKYYFDKIEFKGNIKLPKNYLQRFLNYRKEFLYQEEIIENIPKRILQSGFIAMSKAPTQFFENNKASILLNIKKKKANKFNGILGLSPAKDQSSKTKLTGEFELSLKNSFGKAENLGFAWKRSEKSVQKTHISFEFPFLSGSPLGLGSFVNIDRKDSSWINFQSESFLSFQNYEGLQCNFLFNIKKSEVRQDSIAGFSNFKSILWGFEIKNSFPYEWKNIFLNYNIHLLTGKKTTKERGKITQHQISYLFTAERILHSKFFIRIRSIGTYIFSEFIFENELLHKGGINDLRGFASESVPVSLFSMASIEPTYYFDENSRFFLFYDVAKITKNVIQSPKENHILQSIGFGIDLQIQSGLFSIAWGLGKSDHDSFQLKNSMIHFGYISTF